MSQFTHWQYVVLALSTLASVSLFTGCTGGSKVVDPYRSGTAVAGSAQQANTATVQANYTRDTVLPAVDKINERIASYESRLQNWQGVSSRLFFLHLLPRQEEQVFGCQQQAKNMLAEYKQVHDQLIGSRSMQASRQLLSQALPEVQRKDIRYIEGACPPLMMSVNSSSGAASGEVQSFESAFNAALAVGNYSEVIQAYESLSPAPGQYPAFDLTYGYGLALLKSRREQEGRRVLTALFYRTGELDATRQAKLVQLLADLNFGLGDYATARSRYEELIRLNSLAGVQDNWPGQQLAVLGSANSRPEEVRLYASLLLGFLAYNPPRDGFTIVQQIEDFQQRYPQSTMNVSVQELKRKASGLAEEWFAGLLSEVDRLHGEQKIPEALSLLDQVPADILPLDKQAIVKLKKGSLTSAGTVPFAGSSETEVLEEGTDVPGTGEDVVTETTIASGDENIVPVTALQETWDSAMAAMQAKKYDESIVLFSQLRNSSFGTKAGIQIEEASRLAAGDLRKRAAELFVRSNRATDPDARKQLLLSSRTLLEEILRKYPQSGLDVKVRRNMDRINRELTSIDQSMMTPGPTE